MTEIRKARTVGKSVTLTIPKEMEILPGDYINFEKEFDKVILTKVVIT